MPRTISFSRALRLGSGDTCGLSFEGSDPAAGVLTGNAIGIRAYQGLIAVGRVALPELAACLGQHQGRVTSLDAQVGRASGS
jgi:hypothetical protein